MSNHALLSASASHRWLNCPPSVRLSETLPDEVSTYAEEGSQCHELCAYLVESALGKEVENPIPHLRYYNSEMQNSAEEYKLYVLKAIEKAKSFCSDPAVFIEQRLDFSKWVKDGFGTGDAIIVADEVLQIIDYKHGLGVLVSAEHNSQMMCYALGALEAFDDIYNIKKIEMTIFQPRRENVSTWAITKEELLDWAEKLLAPTAILAYEGKGEFKAGDHCQFCKARAICRKRAEYNLELAKYDFQKPDTLDELEIAALLSLFDNFISWATDVKEYALIQAQNGVHFEGFKIVEGKSNRKYTDEAKVAEVTLSAGFDPYEKKVLGITAMTSLLGKKRFEELLGSLVYKPQGKPTLVPESDKRKAINTAKDDFKETKE